MAESLKVRNREGGVVGDSAERRAKDGVLNGG